MTRAKVVHGVFYGGVRTLSAQPIRTRLSNVRRRWRVALAFLQQPV